MSKTTKGPPTLQGPKVSPVLSISGKSVASTLGPGFLLPGGLGSVPWKDVRGGCPGTKADSHTLGFLRRAGLRGSFPAGETLLATQTSFSL